MGNQQPNGGGDPSHGDPNGHPGMPGAYGAYGLPPPSGPYGNDPRSQPHSAQSPYGASQSQSSQPASSSEDASMTILDSNQTAAAVANAKPAVLDDDTVPTVFRWEHGGRQVYITGTFNGWSRQIPMHRSGNDFTYIHNLQRGKHAFKYIVDDEWRFAPDQPTVADIEGRINNFIDVTDFTAYTGDREFEREKAAAEYGIEGGETSDDAAAAAAASADDSGSAASRPDKDGEVFSQKMPDLDEYTKEPPPLPPHLRHIILNKPPQLKDTTALPVPQHVALNHLYCTAIKENMMVLGITQRYKTKFVTTVYYSPCAK
eukprot:Nitzschia sp. Nitz4//scaffold274_size25273//4168//5115//NITZ4_008324-RA/size25273-processed-gene-0.11-mRNA-1//-1//CDS//3329545272//7366//frame0